MYQSSPLEIVKRLYLICSRNRAPAFSHKALFGHIKTEHIKNVINGFLLLHLYKMIAMQFMINILFIYRWKKHKFLLHAGKKPFSEVRGQ